MCRSAEAFESKDKTLSSLARFQEVPILLLLIITNPLFSLYTKELSLETAFRIQLLNKKH